MSSIRINTHMHSISIAIKRVRSYYVCNAKNQMHTCERMRAVYNGMFKFSYQNLSKLKTELRAFNPNDNIDF